MSRKYTYTNELAPRNTGSVSRPARFNMRLTCSARARTHAVFQRVRESTGMAKDASYADVWEAKILPLVEHVLWHTRESPRAVQTFIGSLFAPLPKEDYVRNRYIALRERFQPSLFDSAQNATSVHQEATV